MSVEQIQASEISDLIKKRIEQFDISSEVRTEGTILSLKDGIVRIHGLGDVMSGEMIEFEGGSYGLALNLERHSVGAGDGLMLNIRFSCVEVCVPPQPGSLGPSSTRCPAPSEASRWIPVPRREPSENAGRERIHWVLAPRRCTLLRRTSTPQPH